MDNYLIVLVQGLKSPQDKKLTFNSRLNTEKRSTTILAFNLLDHSVQEVEIDAPSMSSRHLFLNFLKYGDNQIICHNHDITVITIESFERIFIDIKGLF